MIFPVATSSADAITRDEMIGHRPVALKRALDRLDRDDVGPEIGERLRGQRASEVMIEAEDFDAVEQVHRSHQV
ncbi:hypothetical protein ACVI1J_007815 [Bradyrhizobium diazoefficiens]